MEGDVATSIEALKRRFSAGTDQGLADRLKVGRSTVTSWRRRGAVPKRYMRFLSANPTSLPDFLDPKFDPVERQALVLAILRLIRGYGSKITDYRTFLQHSGFLPAQLAVGIDKAVLDIAARMTEGEIDDPYKALNLIAYEDFFPEKCLSPIVSPIPYTLNKINGLQPSAIAVHWRTIADPACRKLIPQNQHHNPPALPLAPCPLHCGSITDMHCRTISDDSPV